MNIVDVFANVSSASKQDEKKTILKEFGNDSLLTMIFNDTYDKSVVYNVTSKNLKKYHSMNLTGDTVVDVNTYKDFHNLLARLSNRSISGNEALGVVASFIQQFTREDADLLMKILDRNLKIGVTLTQFNKWFGQESWKFEVPLAYLMEKVKNVNPIDGTYYASHKLDGCVDGDTIVEFENGLKLPIREVVDNRMRGKIKSYDEKSNKIVYMNIEDWMHNVEDVDNSQKQWYEIELEDGKILKITGNDSVYVKNKGFVRVDNLCETDEIMVN